MKEKKEARSLAITNVRQQGLNIRSFDALPLGARDMHEVSFTPGQVAVLRVGGENGHFAFASAPEDADLEFLVKRGPGVGGSIYEMQKGDRIDLVDIVGHGFPLDE